MSTGDFICRRRGQYQCVCGVAALPIVQVFERDITDRAIEINTLRVDLDRTRKELELNKKMLARQCDMAREAETKLEELRGKVRKCCNELEAAPEWNETNMVLKTLATLRAAVDSLPQPVIEADAEKRGGLRRPA